MVVAIFSVMTGIAVSSLREVIIQNVENGTARTVAALLKRARAHAISTHSRVLVQLTTAPSPNRMQLCACRSVYGGRALCATGETTADGCPAASNMQAVDGGGYTFGRGDFRSVVVTGPAGTVIFAPDGLLETPALYTFTVDHPRRPGSRTVEVTGAGEVRVK